MKLNGLIDKSKQIFKILTDFMTLTMTRYVPITYFRVCRKKPEPVYISKSKRVQQVVRKLLS